MRSQLNVNQIHGKFKPMQSHCRATAEPLHSPCTAKAQHLQRKSTKLSHSIVLIGNTSPQYQLPIPIANTNCQHQSPIPTDHANLQAKAKSIANAEPGESRSHPTQIQIQTKAGQCQTKARQTPSQCHGNANPIPIQCQSNTTE